VSQLMAALMISSRERLTRSPSLRRPIRDLQTVWVIRSCASEQGLPSGAFTRVFPVPPIGLPIRIAKTDSGSLIRTLFLPASLPAPLRHPEGS
jgi:hypothetical protein